MFSIEEYATLRHILETAATRSLLRENARHFSTVGACDHVREQMSSDLARMTDNAMSIAQVTLPLELVK
jgi:hypothetical protein